MLLINTEWIQIRPLKMLAKRQEIILTNVDQ